MKLLYDNHTGQVLARYSDSPLDSADSLLDPVAREGQTLVTVPDTVAVPDAVVTVLPTGEFVVDSEAVARQWTCMKTHRNQLLKETDWLCSVTDYVVPNREGWCAYRQGLRDITLQANPFRLVWPVAPTV